MHSPQPQPNGRSFEAEETSPANRSFRRILKEFTPNLQAEYLLERYAIPDGQLLLFSAEDLDNPKIIKPEVVLKIQQSLFETQEAELVTDDNLAEFPSDYNEGLKFRIVAGGQIGKHLYLAICIFNDREEMVLPNVVGEEIHSDFCAISKKSFCGYFIKISVNFEAKDEKIKDIQVGISPDLAEHEIARIKKDDFDGVIGQRLNRGLSRIGISQAIKDLAYFTKFNPVNNLTNYSIGAHLAAVLEDGSLCAASFGCDSRIVWQLYNLFHFPKHAEEVVKYISSNHIPKSDALNNQALLWEAEPVDSLDLPVPISTVALHAAQILSSGSEDALPNDIKAAGVGNLFKMPAEDLKIIGNPVSKYFRVFITYLNEDHQTIVPIQNGCVNLGEKECQICVDIFLAKNKENEEIKYCLPVGLHMSPEVLEHELHSLVIDPEKSILRGQILTKIAENDSRFGSDPIHVKGYRISKVANVHGMPQIIFCVEHQYGASLVAMFRIGDTNLISFNADSWRYLGQLDNFSAKKIPAQRW